MNEFQKRGYNLLPTRYGFVHCPSVWCGWNQFTFLISQMDVVFGWNTFWCRIFVILINPLTWYIASLASLVISPVRTNFSKRFFRKKKVKTKLDKYPRKLVSCERSIALYTLDGGDDDELYFFKQTRFLVRYRRKRKSVMYYYNLSSAAAFILLRYYFARFFCFLRINMYNI